MPHSRRTFLRRTSLAVAALPFAPEFVSQTAWATPPPALPLGLPLGIQLYSVRQQMAENFEAALAGIKAAGYTEVEAASLPKQSAAEIRAALDKAGLRCVSAHHSLTDLQTKAGELIAFNKTLGVSSIICPSPGYAKAAPAAAGATSGATQRPFTLADWHYNAEQFNRIGEQLAASGIRFGYHNHTREFVPVEGKLPYMELLRLTDPKKVTMELDCGWAKVAGADPVQLMREHPHRFSMLHLKDFQLSGRPDPERRESTVTELGRGTIDYRPIFAEAARSQHLEHMFVEQEAFDMPWQESLKVDAEYLRTLKV